MAVRIVADTHTILWYLYSDSLLSTNVASLFEAIEQAGEQIAIAFVTLAEIVYLVEKGRIHPLAFGRILAALEQDNPTLVEIPFDRKIAQAMQQIDRSQVPDLPDRMVAATALYLGLPVASRDRKIRASTVETIW